MRILGRLHAIPFSRVLGILIGLTSVVFLLDGAFGQSSPRRIAFSGRTMGTYARVVLVDSDSVRVAPLAARVQTEFSRIDSLMTNWTETSEVARLNREAASGPVALEPMVFEVLDRAVRAGEESNGAFDITVEPLVRLWGFLGGTPHVPAAADIKKTLGRVGFAHLEIDRDAGTVAYKKPGLRVDLGGIAKGYGVERAVNLLRGEGMENALVEISGNISVLGSPPDRDRWSIGVRDPRDRLSYLGVLSLTDRSVATSGKYEQFVDQDGRRYGHILDPRTGWPAEDLLAVTVVAESATLADAWGTAFLRHGAGKGPRHGHGAPGSGRDPGDSGRRRGYALGGRATTSRVPSGTPGEPLLRRPLLLEKPLPAGGGPRSPLRADPVPPAQAPSCTTL